MAKSAYYTKLDDEIILELKKMENPSAWLNQLIARNLEQVPLHKHILHVNGERITVYTAADLTQIPLIRFTTH